MIDITQPLGVGVGCWPGDVPFELEWTLRRDRGDSVDVAAIRMSVHTGTHVDGPLHVMPGMTAGELPLDRFMGPAMVVDARPHRSEAGAVLASALDGVEASRTPRGAVPDP